MTPGQAWAGKLMDGMAGIKDPKIIDDSELELMQVSDTRIEMVKLKKLK